MIPTFINQVTEEPFVGWPKSDEEAKQLISQDESMQNLYDLYRETGESIVQAMEHVFKEAIAIHKKVYGKQE